MLREVQQTNDISDFIEAENYVLKTYGESLKN